MLNSTGSLDLRESAVMGCPLEGPVEEPVHFRIQNKLFGCVPGIARDLWVQPRIVNLTRWSRDRSFELKFNGLRGFVHRFFSFFFFLSLKYCSNWSRRSFQNRSYPCTHP